jgi:hypothetical protein
MRNLGALFLPLFLAACGDLDVRSIREPVPNVLIGEWVGTWQSSRQNAAGEVTVQVREFGGEPLVQIDIDNQCIEARLYDLTIAGDLIELRADGLLVMAATLAEGRRLDGFFRCQADEGTWSATWTRDLPAVVDLGGMWRGVLVPQNGAATTLGWDLVQSVDEGSLRLDGMLELPEVWPVPVLVTGTATFRTDAFDVVLRSVGITGPSFLLSGVGSLEPLLIEGGLMHVFGDPVPFRDATFTIARVP